MKRVITLVVLLFACATLLASAAAQCGPLGLPNVAESAAHWWVADDTALDIVTGAQGTLQNGAGFAPGVAGQAFSFNGVNQNVTVPNSAGWNFGPCDFSISLWAMANVSYSTAPLISHDEGPGELRKWIFWVDPNGGLVFHINSPTLGGVDVVRYDGFFFLTPGTWYHLAVTRTGNLYVLYFNGLPVAKAIDSHIVPSANAPLMIGQAEEFLFNGLIDEVKIYRRGLSAAEVRTFGFLQGVKAIAGP